MMFVRFSHRMGLIMSELLDQISNPDDLKELSITELKRLAKEIRQFILSSVSKTGGHLASNLGVVELTVALHYAFDFKTDKLLWDVGHQCYPHKIITGRKDKFASLRHKDSISGFPNPEESVYDQFAVGHAGTSIATAIGMALGQQQKGGDEKIVALVGDASIVNGVSFEALNNLGLVKRQLLIVLNDNSMAIDATVGALAKYFSKIRLSQTYEDLRKTSKNILEHTPVIGKGVEEAIERIKKSIRMALPASQMFEALNVPYFGPVDGHDIGSLVELFESLSHLDHPAILHVYTEKGRGFTPAEQDLPKYHSTGPFKINGEAKSDITAGRETFTNVFGEHLTKLACDNEKIVAITSAMCDGTGLGEFRKKFADRFYDVGIAESAAVDIAAGFAKSGMIPVVCIYSTFLQRGIDQIFQEVVLQNLPVVFCIDRAGFVGTDGPTHHGLMDIGFLRMMPNVILAAPANQVEMKLALDFAVSCGKCVCLRYPKDVVPPDKYNFAACKKPFKLGKSVTVKSNPVSNVALVAYGSVLTVALEAADRLKQQGISVDVINARFAAPIDKKIVALVDKGKSIITLEDHHLRCGFGSAVLESAAKACSDGIKNTIINLGVSADIIKHDSRAQQLMTAGINADKIIEKVKKIEKLVKERKS